MIDKLPRSLRSTFRFCGSIKLAMLLLAVIIVASVFGTFVESGFSATVAQTYVYDAPWFIAWLLLLCVNLIAAVMVKYPWKPHQYGFMIVHGGIVVMLAGGIIGRIWGVEGNINLAQGAGPQNFLVVNETLLQVHETNGRVNSFPLRLNLREPTPDRPLHFKVGKIDVSVLDVAQELGIRESVEPAGADNARGTPAIRLVMTGDAAPHPIDRWLVKDNPRQGQLTLGRNVIRFAGNNGAPTGYSSAHVRHAADDSCCPTDAPAVPPSAYAPQPGTYPALAAPLTGYDNDDDCCPAEKAASAGHAHTDHSECDPNNPSHHHHHASVPAHENGAGKQIEFRFKDGQLVFKSQTANGDKTGTVIAGEEFFPGWDGWRFRAEKIIERAVVREEIAPMAGTGMRSTGASGLFVRLDDGINRHERWLQMGNMAFVPFAGEFLHLGFGFRLHPLDFTVELDRFEVEFNPGTQTPSSFKSHVTFTSTSGETLSRAVWMNNPTNFPSFFGTGLLGTSYKFSQSSWNPGDLSQTTLQVIRDPGWSLKWIGSLLFCVGLLMIFYLKPYPRFQRQTVKIAKPLS